MKNIQVREDYKDYTPSVDVVAVIRRLLAGAPPHYLVGLDSIVLRNVGRSHPKKRHIRHRGKKVHLDGFEGFYHHSTKNAPAWIELFPEHILPPSMPAWLQKLPLIQDLFFGDVLFHEIGHHIDSSAGKEQDPEAAAEKWRKKLLRHYVRKHYWYVRPFKKVIGLLLKLVLVVTKRKSS